MILYRGHLTPGSTCWATDDESAAQAYADANGGEVFAIEVVGEIITVAEWEARTGRTLTEAERWDVEGLPEIIDPCTLPAGAVGPIGDYFDCGPHDSWIVWTAAPRRPVAEDVRPARGWTSGSDTPREWLGGRAHPANVGANRGMVDPGRMRGTN